MLMEERLIEGIRLEPLTGESWSRIRLLDQ